MNMVYVLLIDEYGRPPVYVGVFSSEKTANEAKRKLELAEIGLFGYAHDYVVRGNMMDAE
jgi:hypothetical protein